jgi:hypothetical protein
MLTAVVAVGVVVLALLWLQTRAEGFSCSPGYQYADGECKSAQQ